MANIVLVLSAISLGGKGGERKGGTGGGGSASWRGEPCPKGDLSGWVGNLDVLVLRLSEVQTGGRPTPGPGVASVEGGSDHLVL